MTEVEWLACDLLNPLLRFLQSDRKFRLFSCACCRRVWEDLDEIFDRKVVEAFEQIADWSATSADHELAQAAARYFPVGATAQKGFLGSMMYPERRSRTARMIQRFDGHYRLPNAGRNNAASRERDEEVAQVTLLREIAGNPFRPVTFSPLWRTDTALSLARTMYDSRDFSAMPILADALQDAGCDNDDILDHCRGPGTHVRGCWVVDLVLGKE
jgi:hypothetical protein